MCLKGLISTLDMAPRTPCLGLFSVIGEINLITLQTEIRDSRCGWVFVSGRTSDWMCKP